MCLDLVSERLQSALFQIVFLQEDSQNRELKFNKWQSALIQHGPHTCIKALDRSIVLMTVAVAITSCAFKPQVAVKEGGLSAVTVGIVHQYVTGTL